MILSTGINPARGLLLALLALASAGHADTHGCRGEGPQGKRVLWGDLHVHTGFSMDAFVFGERITPADAFAFARGAPLDTDYGRRYQLERPLDFAAVTDHAETLGIIGSCSGAGREDGYCQALAAASDGSSPAAFREYFLPALAGASPICDADPQRCQVAALDLWQRAIEAADMANVPCRFTAFIGSEWSPSPGGLHQHRNLIYRSDRVPARPPNAIDEPTAPQLWQALEERCQSTQGCRVLAIPHNTNLSLGGGFLLPEASAQDRARRARFERLLEVHQHKGSSECYPGIGLSDEACAYEIALPTPMLARANALTLADRLQISRGYLRHGLATGLQELQRDGSNSMQFGVIGSTDSHAGRAGYTDEANWQGTFGRYDADPQRRRSASLLPYNPGGLAGVWASANTRAAIFDALHQRETFATSGPRIHLRLFASPAPAQASCETAAEDHRSTMMGGTLTRRNITAPPVFFLEALPDRAPLANLAIVRLRLKDGAVEQRLFQYPSSGPHRGSTCWRFEDRNFDPNLPTLWYARVLEVPTPSWRHTAETPELLQERAWSSALWYEPR